MLAHGIKPAALLVDTIFSSDGVFADPAGFLAPAAAAIREAGGLMIADEVQPGFGRTGAGMWGFSRHGIVPDIVTMGKPMGNGHPVAAMVARPEILERFGKRPRYFNTFGGNPVSCAVGMAVLDVIEDESLIDNARDVGAYLRDGLRGLASGFPRPEDESLIDAVTALSGSGPAYVFHLVECMAAAGVKLGLAPDLAMRLARATVEGSGELMFQDAATPVAIQRQNVTSPAVVPAGEVNGIAQLTGNDLFAYLTVVQTTLMALDEAAKYKGVTRRYTQEGGAGAHAPAVFKATREQIEFPGFNRWVKREAKAAVELPPITETQTLEAVTLKELTTKPPEHFTDATLLDAMRYAGETFDDDTPEEQRE
eukprot:gene39046-52749_t